MGFELFKSSFVQVRVKVYRTSLLFPKKTLELLNCKYVNVYFDKENKLMALEPTEDIENAFAITKDRISSTDLTDTIRTITNVYDCILNGHSDSDKKMIIFDLKNIKETK